MGSQALSQNTPKKGDLTLFFFFPLKDGSIYKMMGRQKIEQKKGKEEVEFKDKGIQRTLLTCNKFHLVCFRLACHQPYSLKTEELISPADLEPSPWEKLAL